jgi:hypothetical protein
VRYNLPKIVKTDDHAEILSFFFESLDFQNSQGSESLSGQDLVGLGIQVGWRTPGLAAEFRA